MCRERQGLSIIYYLTALPIYLGDHVGMFVADDENCEFFEFEFWDTQDAVRLGSPITISNGDTDNLSRATLASPITIPANGRKYAVTVTPPADETDGCEHSLRNAHRNPQDLDWNASDGILWDAFDPVVDIHETGECLTFGCAQFQPAGSPSNYFLLFGYSTI